jgi:ABC transporter substrate binding protein (PQQ-dependent alcohol dehydrogenase system)
MVGLLGLAFAIAVSASMSARAQAAGGRPAAAATAAAGVLRIAVVVREDDERHDERRAALAYPGHPGGTPETAVAVAIEESSFELDAARVQARSDTVAVRSAADLRGALARLEQAGTAAAVVDLPPTWLAGLWSGGSAFASRLVLINVGTADDSLRGAACHPSLWHALPSERMRADALAQTLVARRWSRVLVLHGPTPEDAQRLDVASAALKRHGLQVTATRPFRLSADPRERDQANPALLTAPANAGGEYDVVWVVDSAGEFARTLNYRTALPRPIVGDGGLTAQAWAPNFERFGTPQLSRRFARAARRPMTAHDWAAWAATKAVLQAAMESPKPLGGDAIRRAMVRDGFVIDGFKGARLSFRPWDRQLRQPMLLTDGVGVIGSAPVDGVLHPRQALDTLGSDAPETACKTPG